MSKPNIDPALRTTFETALHRLQKATHGTVQCWGVLRGGRGVKVRIDNLSDFHDADLRKWRAAVSRGGLGTSAMDVDIDRGRVTFVLAYKRHFQVLHNTWPLLLVLLQATALLWLRPERYSLL